MICINNEEIKALRAELIACQELTTGQITSFYKDFFGKEMGTHREIEEWLHHQKDLCRQAGTTNSREVLWKAVRNGETEHVQKLVAVQKKTKRRTRNNISKEIKPPVDRGHSDYGPRHKSSHGDRRIIVREKKLCPKYSNRQIKREPRCRRSENRIVEVHEPRFKRYDSSPRHSEQFSDGLPQIKESGKQRRTSETVQEHLYYTKTKMSMNCPSVEPHLAHNEYETLERIELEREPKIYQSETLSESRSTSSNSERENLSSETDEDRGQFIRETRRAIEAKLKMVETESKQVDKYYSSNHSEQWRQNRDGGEQSIAKPQKKGRADVRDMLRQVLEKNGHQMPMEALYKTFNFDYVVRVLQRKPIKLEKFHEILNRFPDDFGFDEDNVMLLQEYEPIGRNCQPPEAIGTLAPKKSFIEEQQTLTQITDSLNELSRRIRQLELEIPNIERNVIEGVMNVIRKRKSRI